MSGLRRFARFMVTGANYRCGAHMQNSANEPVLFETSDPAFDWEPTEEELSLALELNTLNSFRLQFRRLKTIFSDFKAIFNANASDLGVFTDWGEPYRIKYLKKVEALKPGTELSKVPDDVHIITYFDKRYPPQLREIYDPPPVLYVKGDLKYDYQTSIAIVGTRLYSDYGRMATERFSYQLSSWGFTIISGGARGIDSIAHRTAILAGGKTIGVLGCGINVVFPSENRKLFDEITLDGALISEFPMGTIPEKFNFPARNRIIAALGHGTLVVEAPEKSGALITSDLALQNGKDVFAVPGRLTDKRSDGCNRLIQDGAHMVLDPSDITIRFGLTIIEDDTHNREQIMPSLSGDEKLVFDAVGLEARDTDVLVREVGLSASRVLSTLLVLQTRGLIKELPGSRFIRPVKPSGSIFPPNK